MYHTLRSWGATQPFPWTTHTERVLVGASVAFHAYPIGCSVQCASWVPLQVGKPSQHELPLAWQQCCRAWLHAVISLDRPLHIPRGHATVAVQLYNNTAAYIRKPQSPKVPNSIFGSMPMMSHTSSDYPNYIVQRSRTQLSQSNAESVDGLAVR